MNNTNDKSGWISVKWKMEDANNFTGEAGEYFIRIILGDIYPYWAIMKDGVKVDEAVYHSPVSSSTNKELGAKVQAERYLNKLLSQTKNS